MKPALLLLFLVLDPVLSYVIEVNFIKWQSLNLFLLQQYQSAIRAHKAGRAVDLDELPVPPGEVLLCFMCVCFISTWRLAAWNLIVVCCCGVYDQSITTRAAREEITLELRNVGHCEYFICFNFTGFPPLPGQKAPTAEEGFVAALEAANKLATTDATEVPDGEEDQEEAEEVGNQRQTVIFISVSFSGNELIRCLVPVLVQTCRPSRGREACIRCPPCTEKNSLRFPRQNSRHRSSFTIRSVSNMEIQ